MARHEGRGATLTVGHEQSLVDSCIQATEAPMQKSRSKSSQMVSAIDLIQVVEALEAQDTGLADVQDLVVRMQRR